jgi:hypothetical protein
MAMPVPMAYQPYRRRGRWRIWWLIIACVWMAGLLNRAEKHPASWFNPHPATPPAVSPPAAPAAPGSYQWHPADDYNYHPPQQDQH